MANKDMLDRISEETMRFIRGKYLLDEIGDKKEVRFKHGKKTIFNIHFHEDKYVFQLVYGKQEREKFELLRNNFSLSIQKIYDETEVLHDGKWMFIDVDTLERLEEVKELIKIKRKPDRKPFSKDNIILSKCGMRCDLCFLYKDNIEKDDRLAEFMELSSVVYDDSTDYSKTVCLGCQNKDELDACNIKTCLIEKELSECKECKQFPCDKAPLVRSKIERRSISADAVTKIILPYVHEQYGN